MSKRRTPLSEELTCPVCLELYKHPLVLPCLHSFCRECLEDIVVKAKQSKQNEDDFAEKNEMPEHDRVCVSDKMANQFLECPSCRKKSEMNELTGVGSFPPNFLLSSIIERYKETSENEAEGGKPAAHNEFECDICGTEVIASEAKTCRQCEILYCPACLMQCHPGKGVFSKHSIVSSLVAKFDTDITCPQHGEKMKVYCQDCRVPICYICDRVDGHQHHQAEDIKLAHHASLAEMKELDGDLSRLQEAIGSEMQTLQEHVVNLKAKENDTTEEIQTMYRVLREILENKRSEMLSKVQTSTQEEINLCNVSLSQMMEDVDKIRGVQKILDEAALEQRSAVFLLAQNSLKQRATDTLSQCTRHMDCVHPTAVNEWILQYQEAKEWLHFVCIGNESIDSNMDITGQEPLLIHDSVTISWMGVSSAKEYTIHLQGQLSGSKEEIVIRGIKHRAGNGCQKYTLHGLDCYSVCCVFMKCLTLSGTLLRSSDSKTLKIFPPIKYEDFYFDPAGSQNAKITENGRGLNADTCNSHTSGAYTVYPISENSAAYFEVEVKIKVDSSDEPGYFVAIGLSEHKFHKENNYVPRYMISFRLADCGQFKHCCVLNNLDDYSLQKVEKFDTTFYNADIKIRYGFLLDNKSQTLSIAELTQEKFLHSFDDVCITNPMYPVFLIFGAKRSTSEILLVSPADQSISNALQLGILEHFDQLKM